MGTPIKLQVVQRTDRISASLLIRLKFLPLCYVVDFLRVKKRGVCYFFRMNTEILSFYECFRSNSTYYLKKNHYYRLMVPSVCRSSFERKSVSRRNLSC
jgi:hypothetical protein